MAATLKPHREDDTMATFAHLPLTDEGEIEVHAVSWPPASLMIVMANSTQRLPVILSAREALALAVELTDRADQLLTADN